MNSYRIFVLYLVLHFGLSMLTAQNEDVNWIFSFHTQPPPSGIPGTSVHFTPSFTYKTDTFNVSARGGCTNISDKNGEILFFTNGINIYNNDGTVMTNGDYINPGFINDDYSKSGYPGSQGAVILPAPNDSSSYYLFHVAIENSVVFGATGMKFYNSIVKKNLSNGSFYVSDKNQIILADTLGKGYITATKHANGRDWWLIMPRIASNKYRIYLLDPDGIHLINEQNIGFISDPRDWSGQSVISPDGSKYIRYDQFNQLNIFDFDRCAGILSNPIHLAHPFASPDSALAGGVSVSPNSRYLYLSSTVWIYQYDLTAPDIAASRVLVGEYDGTLLPFPTTFYRAQLAPDGKIYITATNGNRSMHVIHYPDLPGLACGFQNNAVIVDNYIFWGSMPYFPNYRLGALGGSGCDTLNSGTAPIAKFGWQLEDTLQPLTVKFMDQSEDPVSWIWDFGDGNISQDSCPVHMYAQAGIYQVCLTVSNQYGSDTYCRTLYLGLSKTDAPVEKELVSVSPNPFSKHFNVTLNTNLRHPIFRLYDQMGRLVREEHLTFGITEVETGTLSPGMYFWEVSATGERVKSGKIIKHTK